MSDKQTDKKTSENAQQAEELSQKATEEAKLAAEAMRRTIRHRKTQVFEPVRYSYEKIF